MIAAGGSEQERLEARAPAFGRTAQKDVAHSLGARRAARFTRDDDIMAPLAQMRCKRIDLRRLADAFTTLERYEQAAHAALVLPDLPRRFMLHRQRA